MRESLGTRVRRTLGFLLFLALLAAAVFAMLHRQEIQDHFRAVSFEPSPRAVQVLDDLDLTDAGRRIFLASHPTVDGSQHFSEQCAEVDHSEQGHVLGCYTDEQIHLFDVADERVRGIVEVTAAHELLHAAYARLSEAERADLATRLREAYESLRGDHPELAERMAVYEHLSDAAFANELHSVLGTEVRALPRWLEDHYAQWFADRGALLDDFEAYHAVFVELREQADGLEAEMSALRADVERRNAEYEAAVQQFNRDAAEFRARNERFEFSDAPEEFERIRGELAQRRAELQDTLAALQADIDRYNGLRDELEALSQVSSELDRQLNSDLAPVTTRPDS